MRILILAGLMLAAGPAMANGANGTWKTETSESGAYLHVDIAACADDAAKTCGVISKVAGGGDASLVGKYIIRNMQPNGTGKWNKGTIWAPDDDKTYRSKMQLQGSNLKVEGCVAVFCRGQIWTPVN